ncbi:MFS transporter [Streptomyces sp. NPDC058319]|uniref:MFS transporter n=1 Tax=unclassified Streptomyces TaxID=2593676 RepID=UPI0036E799C9
MSDQTRPGALSAGLVLGAFLAPSALGMSATPIALPALGDSLSVASGATAWVLAGYTLTLSVASALAGRLADIRGLRMPIVTGMVLLLAGTVLVVAVPWFPAVIAGRMLQGIGGGVAAVLSFGVANRLFTEPRERGRTIGTMGAVVGIVSGGGALLGGALTDLIGWQAALALPGLSALAAVRVLRIAPATQPRAERLDARGAVLCLALAAALAVLLQARTTHLKESLVLVLAVLAVALAAATVWHVRRVPEGFLPRLVVSNSRFVLAAVAGFTLFAGYLIIQFAAPRLILMDHDLSVTQIGLILLPTGVVSAILSRTAGGLAHKVGPLRLVTALTVLSAAGLLLAALAGRQPVALVIAVAACVSGFSAGQVALMAAVPHLVDSSVHGVAAGVFQLVFITGGSLGSAAVGGMVGAMSLSTAIGVLAVVPLVGMVAAVASALMVKRQTSAPAPAAGPAARPAVGAENAARATG